MKNLDLLLRKSEWVMEINILCFILILSAVVYICGPLETFLNIMKLFQSEIQDPENYAIFYLDVFAESLVDRKPWQNSGPDWLDPIKVFKVQYTHTCTYGHTYTISNNSLHPFGSLLKKVIVLWFFLDLLNVNSHRFTL